MAFLARDSYVVRFCCVKFDTTKLLDEQRFCQRSSITTPRDPPYPPFLRGETRRGYASSGNRAMAPSVPAQGHRWSSVHFTRNGDAVDSRAGDPNSGLNRSDPATRHRLGTKTNLIQQPHRPCRCDTPAQATRHASLQAAGWWLVACAFRLRGQPPVCQRRIGSTHRTSRQPRQLAPPVKFT